MFILCDTSSILMLLRIAPQMFIDEQYQCLTILDIHNEIVRTAKFKTKYPWVKDMKGNLKTTSLSAEEKIQESVHFEIVKGLTYEGTINKATGGIFDLSRVDMKVISHCLELRCKCTSGDRGLVQFLEQEFEGEFQGNVTPLEIVNTWLEDGLIKWNDEYQCILSDWEDKHESPQPPNAKKKFKKLTGYEYSGS